MHNPDSPSHKPQVASHPASQNGGDATPNAPSTPPVGLGVNAVRESLARLRPRYAEMLKRLARSGEAEGEYASTPRVKVNQTPLFHIENCEDETCMLEAIQKHIDSKSYYHQPGEIVIARVEYHGDIVVFYYQLADYLASGNIGDRLLGNAPFFVDKKNGNVFVTGAAFSIEEYIDQYNRGVL